MKNDAEMVLWMHNVRPEDRISADEFRTRPTVNITRECLQHKRLQRFGHLERRQENTWSVKRNFPISLFPFPTKNEGIRSNLKERKVNKGLAKDKNTWKSFLRIQTWKTHEYDIGDEAALWSTQPFILPKLIKWGSRSWDLVVKSKVPSCSGSFALRQLNPIHRKEA